MVRATLLFNVLVLALAAAVLLGAQPPALGGLAAAAQDALARLSAWAGAAWTWAQAALDRAVAWATNQIG